MPSNFVDNSIGWPMRRQRRKVPRSLNRRRRRPFMIDVEEFDFMDDLDEILADWMLGGVAK